MAHTNAMLNEVSGKAGMPHEGNLTKAVEKQTAKIPSIGWLGLAFGAIAVSAVLELSTGRRKDPAAFVGLWVPTFLLFGIYNKLVKLEGSDRFDRSQLIH